jgi:hypothetical protein
MPDDPEVSERGKEMSPMATAIRTEELSKTFGTATFRA